MSSDHASDHASDHVNEHVDAIPESSAQDLILKAVALAAAVVLYGTGIWWSGVALPEATHESAHEQSGASESAPAEHPQPH